MKPKQWIALFIAFAAMLAAQSMAGPATRYVVTSATMTDIGGLGGRESIAWDINDSGLAVGEADTTAGLRHGFLHSTGSMLDIGIAMGGQSRAYGINNRNHVVGSRTLDGKTRPFRWVGGGFELLAHDFPGLERNVHAMATAVADSGHIVGHRWAEDGIDVQSTIWTSPSTFYDLFVGPSGWDSFANDVNESSAAVGFQYGTSHAHRWTWTPSGVVSAVVPLFAATGNLPGGASGINDLNAVVGHAWVGNPYKAHALYWNGTSTFATDLGVLPTGDTSLATDINNGTFIAGYGNVRIHIPTIIDRMIDNAFVYHADFGLYALPRPTWGATDSCRAHALSERSQSGLIQVVGYCTSAGSRRAVRWNLVVGQVPR